MSVIRAIVLLGVLVAVANAQTRTVNKAYLNFGTYGEFFQPAPGFVLTTRNDGTTVTSSNRGTRTGLLQTSAVVVVRVGPNVGGISEGQTVFPTTQFFATGANTATSESIAFCPEPLNIDPTLITGPQITIGNPVNPLSDLTTSSTTSTTTNTPQLGRYCIYHESQIAAIINNDASASSGDPGTAFISNSFGFVPNVAGMAQPTL